MFRKAVGELRKREATLLWLYAPGAMDGDGVGDVKVMAGLRTMCLPQKGKRLSSTKNSRK